MSKREEMRKLAEGKSEVLKRVTERMAQTDKTHYSMSIKSENDLSSFQNSVCNIATTAYLHTTPHSAARRVAIVCVKMSEASTQTSDALWVC